MKTVELAPAEAEIVCAALSRRRRVQSRNHRSGRGKLSFPAWILTFESSWVSCCDWSLA